MWSLQDYDRALGTGRPPDVSESQHRKTVCQCFCGQKFTKTKRDIFLGVKLSQTVC